MRLINRLGSLLLAFVLLGGGLLLTAETVAVSLDVPSLLIERADWYRALTSTRLSDPHVKGAVIGATALGLLILLVQLRPRGPHRVAVNLGDGWHLQRRSVERRLASTADEIPGIRSAQARIRRRGSSWRPRIRIVGDPAARPVVERAIQRELEQLAAPHTEPVKIEMVPGREIR